MTEFTNNHPDPSGMRHCPDCGWRGTIGDMKHSLWVELCEPNVFAMKVQSGGDGMDYDCPKCHYPFIKVRYDSKTIIHR